MDEKQFRYIAAEYAEQYGEELRRELDALEQNAAQWITPALDYRVRREIASVKRRRYLRYAGLAAACLVFAMLTPFMLRYSQKGMMAPDSAQSDVFEAPTPAPDETVYEILPLEFTLPDKFTVAGVEQDIEKTVYYLKNSELDDVVLTMEPSGGIGEFTGLAEIPIDGHDTFGGSGGGYSILAFEERDILYVLTCKHDINTLVSLSKNIFL